MSAHASARAAPRLAARVRLLHVEDDASDAALVRACLQDPRLDGIDLLHAGTLADGLAILESCDVHVTLLDLDLPDSRGIETFERMHRAAAGPIIVLAGAELPAPVSAMLARVAYQVLRKQGLDAATLSVIVRAAAERAAAKLSLAALADSESRFRSLTDLFSDWYWQLDDQLRYVSVVGRGLERHGDRPLSFIGKTRWEVDGFSLVAMSREEFDRLHAERRSYRDVAARSVRGAGDVRYLAISGEPRFDAKGNFAGYHGVTRDVTEQEAARKALRESHERNEIVLSATKDVIWDRDLVRGTIWRSENFGHVFGHAGESERTDSDLWLRNVHPEDRARVAPQAQDAVAHGRNLWSAEYRFRRADGTYADVHDRARVIRDDAGRPVRMIGAMTDITQRKAAERRAQMQAGRQEEIARYGRFALGEVTAGELYEEAVRVLGRQGAAVAAVMEMLPESGEFRVLAAHGEGAADSVGRRQKLHPDNVWRRLLRDDNAFVADRAYLSTRPVLAPWREWIRRMGAAVYAPVRIDGRAHAILSMYGEQDGAFGEEDVRFVEAIASTLSAALQRRGAESRLAYLARFDALTGLANRSLFQDHLGRAVASARRSGANIGVLFIDLDRFKLVNDTLGHGAGDALIAQVGQRLKAAVRDGDVVGRISGDEFAVVLADLAAADDAALVAQKVTDSLARPFDIDGTETYVTASVGISIFPNDATDPEMLVKYADMAMYRAKESGRNTHRFYTPEMNTRSLQKMTLLNDLRHAVARSEFELYFQPKVRLASGALSGVEALLRWNHPQRGLVSPAEFIPALEESGLIVEVGEWVIRAAVSQLRAWLSAGYAPVPVAVNLSARQFRQRDLDRLIRQCIAEAGLPGGLLEIEITESSLMEDPEDAVRMLRTLRDAGVRVSVDDFGTGYSSLAYLTRLPLHALKVDRSFVNKATSDPSAATIVRAVIDMAHNLGFAVVAEGIETGDQVTLLKGYGCEQGQGYYFDRPMPTAGMAARLGRAGAASGRVDGEAP